MDSKRNSKVSFMDNNIGVLRYWCAITIMIAHFIWKCESYFVSGDKMVFTTITRIANFFPGVVVFFAISGFLISASLDRTNSSREFLLKRFGRLFPELWVCTIVNLLLLIITVPFMLDSSIIKWLLLQVFGVAYTPSCLKTFGANSINGALWTVFTELQFYIIIFLIHDKLKKLTTRGWITILTFFWLVNLGADYADSLNIGALSKIIERFFATYFIWFLMGAFVYHYREKMLPFLRDKCHMFLGLYSIGNFVEWGRLSEN